MHRASICQLRVAHGVRVNTLVVTELLTRRREVGGSVALTGVGAAVDPKVVLCVFY